MSQTTKNGVILSISVTPQFYSELLNALPLEADKHISADGNILLNLLVDTDAKQRIVTGLLVFASIDEQLAEIQKETSY